MANGILINDISDHLPIYTMVDYKKERTDKYKKDRVNAYVYKRLLGEQHLSLLSQKLNEFDWEVVTQKADVNDSYCNFFLMHIMIHVL